MRMEEAVKNPPQSPLTDALQRAIDVCETTLDELREEPANHARRQIMGVLLLAVGAFETALLADRSPHGRDASLTIAATLGHDAAAAAQRHGRDDDRLLRCAAPCASAASRCEAALSRRA